MPLRRKIEGKIFDVDASMQGSLKFKEPVNLRINGKFEGTLELKGILTVGKSAQLNAQINGDHIIIAGKVKGRIVAREGLSLLSTAIVEGDIYPRKLSVAEGAIFDGKCFMLGDFLNTEDLARYLEVDLSSVLEWANSGKIPAQKDGNSWKFERKAIDSWVASGKV